MILTHIFRWLKVAAAMLAVAALGACTEPAGEIQEPTTATGPGTSNNSTTYRAGFYLTVSSLSAPETTTATATRATPAGGYNPGSGIENFINLENDDIRVFIYSTANKFLSELTDLQIVPVSDYDSSKLYFINGATQTDISSGNFKIMVVANWPEYPESDKPEMDDFFKITFNFNGSQPTRELPIPMYGIKEVNVGTIRPDNAANLGTIHLIRALAKIEVIFENPDEKWNITDLKLTHYNTTGFCAPEVRSQSDYVKDDWDRDYVGRPFIPSNTSRANDLDFIETENGHYVLFVPEYVNTSTSEPAAQIHAKVSFDNYDWAEHLIDLKNGTAKTDIMRNIWYKVTIKKIRKSDIDITVDVIPYAVCDLDPIFGLS